MADEGLRMLGRLAAEFVDVKYSIAVRNGTIACQSHCCLIHGCKYSNTNCPVANAVVVQDYPCEMCAAIGVTNVREVIEYEMGKLQTCPHCNHVLSGGQT